jgi:hypothetical protein
MIARCFGAPNAGSARSSAVAGVIVVLSPVRFPSPETFREETTADFRHWPKAGQPFMTSRRNQTGSAGQPTDEPAEPPVDPKPPQPPKRLPPEPFEEKGPAGGYGGAGTDEDEE